MAVEAQKVSGYEGSMSRHLHGVVPELDEDGLDVDGTLSVVKGEEIETDGSRHSAVVPRHTWEIDWR